jgi:hypothetical protein
MGETEWGFSSQEITGLEELSQGCEQHGRQRYSFFVLRANPILPDGIGRLLLRSAESLLDWLARVPEKPARAKTGLARDGKQDVRRASIMG